MHRIATILRSLDRDGARCQQTMAKDALRCIDVVLKEFGRCEKRGLADGTINRRSSLDACLGVDTSGKIAKTCDAVTGKIGKDIVKRCSTLDLATVFSGCASADLGQTSACIADAAACRGCLLLDEGKALGHDCDLFDDGVANGSCL